MLERCGQGGVEFFQGCRPPSGDTHPLGQGHPVQVGVRQIQHAHGLWPGIMRSHATKFDL